MTRRTWVLLLLIWAAFLVRGGFYSTFTPLWEGWDEYWHFAFVQHLEQGRGLPSPNERISAEIARSLELTPLGWTLSYQREPSATHEEFWRLPAAERLSRIEALNAIPRELQTQPGWEVMFEGKQPPLYYALAAMVLRPIRYASLVDREFVLRLFSVLLASSVVFLAFACAKRVWNNDVLALHVAALISVMPQLFTSVSRVSNEALAIPVFSLLTYWIIRAAGGDTKSVYMAEITLGVGLLTKAYFIAAVPAVAAAVLVALWREPRKTKLYLFLKTSLAAAMGLSVCLWWYVRTLGTKGPVWDDAAPAALGTWSALTEKLSAMSWLGAMDFTFNSHIWLAGWSVMGLRSWMYHTFRYAVLLALVGLLLFLVRAVFKQQPGSKEVLFAGILYSGFWGALLYHAFVSFSKGLPAASGGWYLLAAVIPEVLLAATGYFQFIPASMADTWKPRVLTIVTGAFVLLEMYALHIIALPYYAGFTRHAPAGNLMSFHIGDAAALGWGETLSRIAFNKPTGITPMVFLGLWAVFIVVSLTLPFLPKRGSLYTSGRGNSDRRQKRRKRRNGR